MDLLERLFDNARRRDRKIVLPVGEHARIVAAAVRLKKDKLAKPILLGSADVMAKIAAEAGHSLAGIELIDPRGDARLEAYGAALAGLRTACGQNIGLRLLSLRSRI
jgi:phosphate acetyltransferase